MQSYRLPGKGAGEPCGVILCFNDCKTGFIGAAHRNPGPDVQLRGGQMADIIRREILLNFYSAGLNKIPRRNHPLICVPVKFGPLVCTLTDLDRWDEGRRYAEALSQKNVACTGNQLSEPGDEHRVDDVGRNFEID
jgi:hypothetical protein